MNRVSERVAKLEYALALHVSEFALMRVQIPSRSLTPKRISGVGA